MHRFWGPLIFALFTLMGLSLSQAFQVPALYDGVMDQAGLLDSNTQKKLSNALKIIFDKGGPQVAVLTVDSIDPLTIEEASIQVAKSWKLGTEQKDNGVLVLIAKRERKIRIEVGQGVEGDLTDAYSRRIIDDVMVPLFRRGQTTEGVLLGVREILSRMNPPYDLADYLDLPSRVSKEAPLGDWGELILILIVLAVLIYLSRGGGGRGFHPGYGGYGGGFGSSYGGGGFGGSSGGWSGGGGGFSGGGASGSW